LPDAPDAPAKELAARLREPLLVQRERDRVRERDLWRERGQRQREDEGSG